jgi:hypothetical protein|tara:strand:+ start:254 stop:709 length:456 start_codon:yes stop_codon:yes gene_type:complete
VRIINKLLLVLSIAITSSEVLFANYAFYRQVTSTCKSYHVEVSSGEMSLSADNKNFAINLTSRRNNFELIMLVGFAAAGKAIIHQKHLQGTISNYNPVIPGQVNVIVTVPIGRDNTIFSAEANSLLVQELADGSLDSSDFMRKIKDSIQTL